MSSRKNGNQFQEKILQQKMVMNFSEIAISCKKSGDEVQAKKWQRTLGGNDVQKFRKLEKKNGRIVRLRVYSVSDLLRDW